MPVIAHGARTAVSFLLVLALIPAPGAARADTLVGTEEVVERLRSLPAFESFPEENRKGLREMQAQVPNLRPP